MASIKISRDIGPLAAAIFFVILGLHFLGILSGSGITTVLGILALVAGVCQLLELK